MTDDTQSPLMLVLCKGPTGSPLTVDLESFLKFNAQMDIDLRVLVDSWSDFSTPRSQTALDRAGRHPRRD